LREDLQSGLNEADFMSSFGPETYGIVVANIHLAITKLPNDQMKRILLLSILCPQFVARSCWGGDGLDTWTVRSNSLSSTNWLSVASGKGRFVAVGSSGVVLESGPVIHLGSPQMLSLGAVQFALTGPVGLLCQLQTSTDFANWVALTDLLIAEPSTTFIIISSNSPGRFYRIAAP
jgi:hypothetical protein